MFRWRQGLSRLDGAERFRVLEAEQKAKHMAVEFNCAERIVEHPYGLADCSDIGVRSTRVRWVRKRGQILVHILVFMTPDDRLFEVKWKLHPTKGRSKLEVEG